jgi:curved DNA-binding protein CbpA
MNPYVVLGVGYNATDDDIQKAWRAKSREHHPDREGGNDEAMASINKARDILLDPVRRERFAQSGETDTPKDESSLAAELLITTARQLLADCDTHGAFPTVNFIKTMNARLRQQRNHNEEAIRGTVEKMKHLDSIAGRIKHNGDGESLFEIFFDGLIKEVTAHLAILRGQKETLERAIGLIGNYDFDETAVVSAAFLANPQQTFNITFSGDRP